MLARTLALALLLLGCTPSQPSVPVQNSTPTPLNRTTSADHKISLSLPGDWMQVDPGAAGLSSKQLQGSVLRFVAMNKRPVDGFQDNCNLIQKNGVQLMDYTPHNVEAVQASLLKSLQVVGPMSAQVVQLPMGKAFRFQAELLAQGTGGSARRTLAIIYITHLNGSLYQLTFVGRAQNRQLFAPLADEMAQTMEIKP